MGLCYQNGTYMKSYDMYITRIHIKETYLFVPNKDFVSQTNVSFSTLSCYAASLYSLV